MNNREELFDLFVTAAQMLRLKQIECEITIVGGFAIFLNFPDFPRETYDIDVLSNNYEVAKFGFSLGAMDVIEGYGDFKNNRILLKEYSSDIVKIYVLSPEALLSSKRFSNRPEPDQDDIKFLLEKLEDK